MENNNTIFIEKYSQLAQFQKDKIDRFIIDFLTANEEAQIFEMNYCPKCDTYEVTFTKGGKTQSNGKQLYRCSNCGKRITYDHGSLAWYSHHSQAQWLDVIKHTLDICSITTIASEADVHERSALRMRHKVLHALLNTEEINEILDEVVECDEIYFPYSHKGEKQEGVSPKKRGTPASKPGLSKEQCCLITAVDRKANNGIFFENMASPKESIVKKTLKNIFKPKCFFFTDGHKSYNLLITDLRLKHQPLKEYNQYDSIHHLNTVNSLHSKISSIYSFYKGVASKHWNLYNALLSITWKYKDYDTQEKILILMRRFNSRKAFITYEKLKENSKKVAFRISAQRFGLTLEEKGLFTVA